MTLVVDASVVFKWFIDEAGSDLALALRKGGHQLIAPELIVGEACNAAWKAFRRGELSADQCLLMTAGLVNAFSRLVSHVVLAHRAMQLSVAIDHPFYDCLYLALAEQESTVVVTSDRRLISKVGSTAYKDLVRDLATPA